MSLETLIAEQEQRQEDTRASYRELVAHFGRDGKDVDADELQQVLEAAGKNSDELLSDVQRYNRRLALRAQLDELPKMKERLPAIDDEAKKASEALKKAEQKYHRTVQPLVAEKKHLERQILNTNQNVVRDLRNSCDPELKERLEALRARKQQLLQPVDGARRHVGRMQAQLTAEKSKPEADSEKLAFYESQLRGAENKYALLAEQENQVVSEIDAVLEQMLEP